MASILHSFLIFLAISSVTSSISRRPRNCCRYSTQPNSKSSAKCPSSKSCSIHAMGSDVIYPNLEQCSVEVDNKVEKNVVDSSQCTNQDFTSSRKLADQVLVKAYLLDLDNSYVDIFGLELAIPYDKPWSSARFRWTNKQGCSADDCTPRCVHIDRKGAMAAPESGEFLHYDCEIGLYHTLTGAAVPTHGSTYGLDVCLDDACNSFLVMVPESSNLKDLDRDDGLVLIEVMPLIQSGTVTMHFPPGMENKNISVKIETVANETKEGFEMYGSTDKQGIFDRFIGMQLSPKVQYSIFFQEPSDNSSSSWIKVAEFQTGSKDSTVFGLVLFVICSLLLLVCFFGIFKRYRHIQETHQVHPNRLLESGRIKPRNVLIISNVDNRHHIDVVLAFSRYLKTHCAIGEVYFALDPHTGITSQESHDPWKWAQQTADMIAKDNGFLIFIAGPPAGMGLAIYKDLPNNQAFVGTAHLKTLAEGKRLAVVHLPYSDPETVPVVVPIHIRNEAFDIPREMNAFLCQLLEVKMRELFPFIPFPIVRPKILPHDLALYKGGHELMSDIENLSIKVERFKAEQKQLIANGGVGTMTRTEDSLVPPPTASEKRFLLSPAKKSINLFGPASVTPENQRDNGLKVNIEAEILSLDDPNRDKSVNLDIQ